MFILKSSIILTACLVTGCVSENNLKSFAQEKVFGTENSLLSYFLKKSALDSSHQQIILVDVNTALNDKENKNYQSLTEINSCIEHADINSLMKKEWESTLSLTNQSSVSDVLIKFKQQIC